jgi:flagellar motor switch protein FliN/FliY
MSQAIVTPIVVPELTESRPGGTVRPINILGSVPATVTVVAGRAEMTLREMQAIGVGDVIGLDRSPDATVDIYVNGTHIARGDIIVLDETIATRVSELDPQPGSP